MENKGVFFGVGRRKKSVAIVKMKEGQGNIIINKRPFEQYFPLFFQQEEVIKPLIVTDLKDKFDFEIKAEGGG
ncbi:MAG: mitochondrial small ribosomal subunit protein uS9m, partial [bacterium]|nr:mitochondrial small ribosomal subunit protein uS9m [bacterium]MDW8163766.1 30S ribosomal protein S9 [Candidatus Omnitrophota bacterium]